MLPQERCSRDGGHDMCSNARAPNGDRTKVFGKNGRFRATGLEEERGKATKTKEGQVVATKACEGRPTRHKRKDNQTAQNTTETQQQTQRFCVKITVFATQSAI